MKMKRECFMPTKHSRVRAKHFTEDSFQQNLVVRSLLGPSFKIHQLVVTKDMVPMTFNCMQLNKTMNNKQIMPIEQLANSAIS